MTTEMLDIYDDNFQYGTVPIGQKERKAVHRDGDWHKGFHCWIIYRGIDNEPRILFQRRSAGKGDEAFALDITAAGHLKSGESSRDGVREIEEELGLKVDFSKLVSLGIIVEVAAYNGKINREFDEVFLLENSQQLENYQLQYEEVDGLTELKVADGLLLFGRQVESITGRSIRLEEHDGNLSKIGPFEHELTIKDFGGEDRGNYYIKILIIADLYFKGYKHLYI